MGQMGVCQAALPDAQWNKAKRDQGSRDAVQYRQKPLPLPCWLNWDAISAAEGNKGNVLYSDEKFLTLLYQRHEDRFENLSLVRDAGNQTMRNLEEMLKQCENCILVVDCENSDAVKLAARLSSLSKEELRRIRKILLFDSEYTTTQWATLVDRLMKAVRDTLRPEEAEESLRLEHIMVPRLNQSKSQVDMTLAVRTSREVYGNHAGGVILVSSDSDYWAMIRQLEGVRFLVMLEKEKADWPLWIRWRCTTFVTVSWTISASEPRIRLRHRP